MGLISYSLYLWHQPLFAFARQRSLERPSEGFLAFLALIAMLLAYLTWRFVERPFRNKHLISRIEIFRSFGFLTLLFIGLGLVGALTNGTLFHTSFASEFDRIEWIVRSNHGLDDACGSGDTLSPKCTNSSVPEIIVWGDSYAMHLVDGIISSNPNAQILQLSLSLCGPIFDVAPFNPPYGGTKWGKRCIAANDNVRNILKSSTTVKYVLISSVFSQYASEKSKLLTRDGRIISGEDNAYTLFINTLKEIESLGIKPVIFSPTPSNGNNIGRCLIKARLFNVDRESCNFDLEASDKRNLVVNDLLRKLQSSYKVIWLSDGICSQGVCKAAIGDVFVYRDSGHLSHEGSAYIGKQMGFYHLITGKAN